jgi:hypothetical protein
MALKVLSELSTDEVILEEDSSEVSTINIQSFVDEQEWRLYRNVEVRKSSVGFVYTATSSDNALKHSSISVLCHASRRFGFYVWNIMFVMVCCTEMTTSMNVQLFDDNCFALQQASFYAMRQ